MSFVERPLSIIQTRPRINTDYLRRYTSPYDGLGRQLLERLPEMGMTPDRYPRAIDICAGDGPIASILLRLGWEPVNITCVDINKTRTPVVRGVKWLHWDLEALGRALVDRQQLPPQVEAEQGQYDVALMVQAHDVVRWTLNIGDFFLRQGGVFHSNHLRMRNDRMWQPFNGSSVLYEKR